MVALLQRDEEKKPDEASLEGCETLPGLVAVVCDGVGGENAGEVASQKGAVGFLNALRRAEGARDAALWPETLRAAVVEAHHDLLRHAHLHPELEGMGTTLTGVLVVGRSAWLAHIGDSRLYRWRGSKIELLSSDHSLVGQQYRDGLLTEEEARRHPLRNILEKVLGGGATEPSPDVQAIEIQDRDLYLLCSDGLTDSLRDRDIARVLREGKVHSPREVAAALLQAALDTGGRDNISIVLLDFAAPPSSFLSRLFS